VELIIYSLVLNVVPFSESVNSSLKQCVGEASLEHDTRFETKGNRFIICSLQIVFNDLFREGENEITIIQYQRTELEV
jgi:hypothetical protein